MKNYHDYPKIYMGSSDVAALIVCGPTESGLKAEVVKFGGDSSYHAYVVDEDALIADHYHLVATFNHWISIYDDSSLVFQAHAKKINVYRSGAYGFIVQEI